jgi:hypothetical protein
MTEENHEIPVSITGASAEFGTKQILNTSPELCLCTVLFGSSNCHKWTDTHDKTNQGISESFRIEGTKPTNVSELLSPLEIYFLRNYMHILL